MDVAELNRQVEYKQAPEPLIAVQALVNTYSFEDDEELLLTPESTADWLGVSDLAAPGLDVGPDDHGRLVGFREALRTLVEANLSGEPSAEASATFAAWVARHPVKLAAGPGGAVGLDLSPAGSVDDLIGQMTGIVFQAQREDLWSRLKICASDDCRWAFFDASKNRGGHWCRMDLCGNRVKNRRYRRRGGEASASRRATSA